jgi:hypothetical protein
MCTSSSRLEAGKTVEIVDVTAIILRGMLQLAAFVAADERLR